MSQKIREVMTEGVTKLSASANVVDAARTMRDNDIGAVVVEDGTGTFGVVTDRDIAVRAVAKSLDPSRTLLGDICSRGLVTLSPDDDTDRAVELMRSSAIRRIPIIEDEQVVGMVSLGDLAIEKDRLSVLGQISAAAPTR